MINLLIDKLSGRLDFSWKIEHGSHLVCKCGFSIQAEDPRLDLTPEALTAQLSPLLHEVFQGHPIRLRRCAATPTVDWIDATCVTGARFPVCCEFDNQFEQTIAGAPSHTVLTGPIIPWVERRCLSSRRFANLVSARFFADFFSALTRLPEVAAKHGLPMTSEQQIALKYLIGLHTNPNLRLPWFCRWLSVLAFASLACFAV